jgi:hypothetical protein
MLGSTLTDCGSLCSSASLAPLALPSVRALFGSVDSDLWRGSRVAVHAPCRIDVKEIAQQLRLPGHGFFKKNPALAGLMNAPTFQ